MTMMTETQALGRRSHPRTLSSSSSSSSSSSISSSHSPSLTRTKSQTSWTMQQRQRPSSADTTSNNNIASSTDPLPNLTLSSRNSSPVRRVSGSPPSSPLPLSFRAHNNIDIESEDGHQPLSPNYSESPSERSTPTKTRYHHSQAKEQQPSDTEHTRRDHSLSSKHSSTRTTTKRQCAADISNRPRFTLSTSIRPRPLPASTVITSIAPSPSVKNTRSVSTKERGSSQTTKSNADSLSTTRPDPSKALSTKSLKSRPATITTTTMSTTRRVVSTTINVGQHGDINHRKESTVTKTVVAAKGVTCKSDRTAARHRLRPSSASSTSSSRDRDRTRQCKDTSPEPAMISAATKCDSVNPCSSSKEINNSQSGTGATFEILTPLLPAADVDDKDTGLTDPQDRVINAFYRSGSTSTDFDTAALSIASPSPSPQTEATSLLSALTLCGTLLYDNNKKLTEREVASDSGPNSERLNPAADRPELYHPSPSIPLVSIRHILDGGKNSSEVQHVSQTEPGPRMISEFTQYSVGSVNGGELGPKVQCDADLDIASITTEPRQVGSSPKRKSLLTVLWGTLSDTPLTKVKDPAVMMEVMTIMKERRISGGLNKAPATTKLSMSGGASCEERLLTSNATLKSQHNDKINDYMNYNNIINDAGDSGDSGEDSGCFIEGSKNLKGSSLESPSAAKISLQAKKTFLQLQETRRASALRVRQSLDYTVASSTVATSSSTITPNLMRPHDDLNTRYDRCSSPPLGDIAISHALPICRISPPSQTPAPTTPVDIPCKAATVLKDMGYPLYRSPSSMSTLSSTSTTPSASYSLNAPSTPRSTSSMSLHSSFPERLFQSRSPSPLLLPQGSRSTCSSPAQKGVGSQHRLWLSVPRYNLWSGSDHEVQEDQESIFTESPSSCHRRCQTPSHNTPLQEPLLQRNNGNECSNWSAYPSPSPFQSTMLNLDSKRELVQQQHEPVDIENYNYNDGDRHSSTISPSGHYSTPSYFDRKNEVGESRLNHSYVKEAQRQYTGGRNRVHDISMLTKRLANLQLMESLCPSEQQQQQQQHSLSLKMDSAWSFQIEQLLVYLADQADREEKLAHPTPMVSSVTNALATSTSTISSSSAGAGTRDGLGLGSSSGPPLGIYEQVLKDWVLRLDQISDAVYVDHPGLKREVDKIRWQHGFAKLKKAC